MSTREMMPLHEWSQPSGVVTTWQPTEAALAAAQAAVPSSVPPSYQQRQHIRTYERLDAEGIVMSRLLITAWTEPGICNTDAMTQAIEAHLLRHDTYASRFVVAGQEIERRIIADGRQIRFEPVEVGAIPWAEWRESLLDTPGPLDWDCFRFHVVQYDDHFTFCACLDHVNGDGAFSIPVFGDIHDTYAALTAGLRPPTLAPSAGYLDYCERQTARVRALTPQSDEVRMWKDYLRPLDPSATTPLPVGPVATNTPSVMRTHPLMDAATADAFEQACLVTGCRLIGGVLGAVALAWTEIATTVTFRAIVPFTGTEERPAPDCLGWYVGVVPVAFSVCGSTIEQAMTEAQGTYGAARHLNAVPPQAVWDVLGEDQPPDGADWSAPFVSFIDMTKQVSSVDNRSVWHAHGGYGLLNEGASTQISLWFMWTPSGASLTTMLPDTPAANSVGDRLAARIADLCRDVAMRLPR